METELLQAIRIKAEQIIRGTGMVELTNNINQRQLDQMPRYGDFAIATSTPTGNKIVLLFEVKRFGQPKYVQEVANRFKGFRAEEGNAWYGVFGAPYISPTSMQICRENGIGCLDTAGNCYLKFDNVYIDIQGRRNPFPEKRPLKSIFYRKSARVIRTLLLDPSRDWLVKDLSDKAGVSIGQASNVKSRLEDYGFIEVGNRSSRTAIRLKKPDALLNEWAANYSYKKNVSTNFYSLDETAFIEKSLSEYCESKGIRYAFTLTSGANLIAPFLRYKRVFAYVDAPTSAIAEDLGWKEVSSGANIALLRPYDESVFWELQVVDGKDVVSDIQLYLDLSGYEQRGAEAAEQILKRLEDKW